MSKQLRDKIISSEIHKKLSDGIIEMITSYNLPYYGEFCQFINFYKAKIGTCGVNVTSKGMNFYWDPEWVEKRTRQEIIFTIVHEDMHLLFDHIKRGVGYDHKVANIAQDMIINSIIHGDLIVAEGLSNTVAIPKDEKGRNTCVFIPKEYKGLPVFEEVYNWLMAEYNKWRNENSDKIEAFKRKHSLNVDKNGNVRPDNSCPNCGKDPNEKPQSGQGKEKGEQGQGKEKGDQGQGGEQGEPQDVQGQGQPGDGEGEEGDSQESINNPNAGKCPHCGEDMGNEGAGQRKETEADSKYGPNGKSGDNGENDVDMYPMESWFENMEYNKGQSFDVHFDDDVPEEVRKEWIESHMEKLKQRGLQTGNIEKILNKLRKAEKDYLKEIKRTMSNEIFGSIKQKSITKPNRRDIFGIKGKKKYKTAINVLLDTSGSMSGNFEKVLSYIFRNDVEMNLIQCDTDIKQVIKVTNKKQLERMKIMGLGGTEISPGLQYIAHDKKLNLLNTLVLTDGYTDSLNLTGVRGKVLVLSTDENCPVSATNGKLKQIILPKDRS